jgi:hypothetical protein
MPKMYDIDLFKGLTNNHKLRVIHFLLNIAEKERKNLLKPLQLVLKNIL